MSETLNANRPKRSESISKLAAALSKAQGQMLNADKDGKGTYGKYATLAATWDAIRKPLADNELAVYQRILTDETRFIMATMLIHSSGEFVDDCEVELKIENNGRMNLMQAMGSAVTYARRYSLQSVVGVAPADDDDGVASGDPKHQDQRSTQTKAKPVEPRPAPAKPVTPAIKPTPPKVEAARSEQTPEPSQVAQDAFDTKANAPVKDRPASREEINALVERAGKRGWPTPLCTRFIKQLFGKENASQLTLSELNNMLNSVQTMTGLDATAMLDHMAKSKA